MFLLDDHEIVRRGVAELLETEADIEVVGEAGTPRRRWPGCRRSVPTWRSSTSGCPTATGVSVCRDIRSAVCRHRPCLMLTSYSDDEALFEAIMAGASGYLLKQILGQDLVAAVRTVAAGGSLLDPRPPPRCWSGCAGRRSRPSPLAELSEQERTVLELIGEGLTNRQIGERMFLAEKTVKNYVSHLLAKLGLERRTQAAVLATELRRSGGHGAR